jgi:MFS family permease
MRRVRCVAKLIIKDLILWRLMMLSILKNKQIRYLFLTSFAVLFTGMGLFPILPLYAAQFQASNSLVGLYFAIVYAANALGPVAAGWLITRLSLRTVFIAGGSIGLPALILLATAHNFVQVIIFTSLLWFSGGVIMALVSILTGLQTDINSRGKAYSLIAMVSPLGSLIGGGVVGWMITWQGYSAMFSILAVVWSIVPLIGWFSMKEIFLPQQKEKASVSQPDAQTAFSSHFGTQFTRLLMVVFLGSIATNVSRFASSLSMQAANYSAESIASAAMISGLVAIPFTLAIGSLADRLGRRHFLGISFLFILFAAVVLMNAKDLWQYWLASILNMLGYSVSGAMAQALTGEVVAERTLGRGLSWMSIISSIANILCFAVGGLLVDLFGLFQVFLMAALVAFITSSVIELFFRPGSYTQFRTVKSNVKQVTANKCA